MANFPGLDVPTGSVVPCVDTYGLNVNTNTTTLGDGWLTCNGGQHLESKYPDLFNVIGTTYNTDNESAGHFRVPDLQDRIPKCATSSIGTLGGSSNYTITSAQMPSHSHSFSQSGHYHYFSNIYGDDYNNVGGTNYGGGFWKKSVVQGWHDGANNIWNPNTWTTQGESLSSGAVSDTHGASFGAIPASKKVVFIIKT